MNTYICGIHGVMGCTNYHCQQSDASHHARRCTCQECVRAANTRATDLWSGAKLRVLQQDNGIIRERLIRLEREHAALLRHLKLEVVEEPARLVVRKVQPT